MDGGGGSQPPVAPSVVPEGATEGGRGPPPTPEIAPPLRRSRPDRGTGLARPAAPGGGGGALGIIMLYNKCYKLNKNLFY